MVNVINSFLNDNIDSGDPNAFLSCLIFDENLKLKEQQCMKQQISIDNLWHNLQLPDFECMQNGFVYIFCSNGAETSVFFDDIEIEHTTGNLIEEVHYYPFGLSFGRYTAMPEYSKHKKLFNSQQYEDDEWADNKGIKWYDFDARNYDPQIGRWHGVDPLVADAPGWSPYRAFFCNPIRYTDPDGQWEWDATGNLVAQKGDNSYSMAKFLGTSQSNAMQMLNRGGVTANAKGVLNLKEGQSFARNDLWVGTKSASGPVVNNTKEALAHYFIGNGAAADVGDQSTRELLSSPEFTKAHSKITSGLSELDHGFVKVDMEFSTFYIGTTQFKYDVSGNGNSNSVNYKLFYSNVWGSDGFWDPDYIGEYTLGKIPYVRDWTGTKPDGPGPNLERFGGTPYHYKTRERTFFFKPVKEQK